MANIIKIDNAVLKRTARVEKKRKEHIREVRVYFLIVCKVRKQNLIILSPLKQM